MNNRYQRRHPADPWLTPEAIRFIAAYLQETDCALEVGSGRSTAWIGSRVRSLTSIESNQSWFERVGHMLDEAGLRERVDLVYAVDASSHLQTIGVLPDRSLDFCLIDGKHRGATAVAALPKMKPGGLLVVDDVHRYLPDDHTRSPCARRTRDGVGDAHWEEFVAATRGWRSWRTSSGITDDGLWLCPADRADR